MNKNKILFNTTNAISFMGSSVFSYIIAIWVIKNTNTTSTFANITSLSFLPLIFVNLLAGTIADKVSKKVISITSDIVSGIALIVAYLLINDKNLVYIIGILLIITKSMDSFYSISMKALIKEIFHGDDVRDVNSAYSLTKQVCNMIGPYIGSLLLLFINYKAFLLINSFSYLISSIFTFFIRDEKINKHSKGGSALFEGWKYFYSNKKLMFAIFAAMIANFFLASVAILLPYISLIKLNYSDGLLSTLLLVEGIGAVCAPFILKVIEKRIEDTNKLMLFTLFLGMLSLVFAFPTFYFLASSMFLSSLFITAFNIYFFTNVNENTDERYIGKVMGIIYTLSMISIPLGTVFWGNMEIVQSRYGLIIVGIIGSIAILFFIKIFRKRANNNY